METIRSETEEEERETTSGLENLDDSLFIQKQRPEMSEDERRARDRRNQIPQTENPLEKLSAKELRKAQSLDSTLAEAWQQAEADTPSEFIFDNNILFHRSESLPLLRQL